MPASSPPAGYNVVSPYLIVDGARGTLAFLARVFDATELRVIPTEDGSTLAHAEVRIGDSVVMLADRQPDWPTAPAHVHVYVADVDATYRRALDAGATSVQEPMRKDDTDRRAGVRDAGGTTWWIATPVG